VLCNGDLDFLTLAVAMPVADEGVGVASGSSSASISTLFRLVMSTTGSSLVCTYVILLEVYDMSICHYEGFFVMDFDDQFLSF
jgi:hypothetical protein